MRIFLAVRFLFALGLRVDAVRLLRATALAVALYAAAPLAALALRGLTDDVLAHRAGAALIAVVLAAVALVAQIMLGHFCHLDLVRVSDAQEMRLRGELTDLVNGPPRIDHLDRSEVADTVDLVRDNLLATTRSLEAVLQLAGLLVQMTVTIVLLGLASPLFAILPLCTVISVLLERTAQSTVENARERTAERLRLAKHLLELATSTGPVRELRLFGAEDEILHRQRAAWDEVTTAMWRAHLKAAVYRALGQGFFVLGYGGAVVLELYGALRGQASVGDLVLVITLAVQVSVQVSGALGVLSQLQVAGRTTDRIGQLRAVASATAEPSAGAGTAYAANVDGLSSRLTHGITLEDVSFTYPGAERPVLSGVSMHIPAGSTLALVGENGAGKSTLVKLLCGLYRPTSGRVLVDGHDLAGLDPTRWRSYVAALFQDFHHIELTLGESIGHGDIARASDTEAVTAAAGRARADRVLRTVPGGLNGYVGHSYADGTELSGGQWQTVALARTLMRQHPLLLILDEPAAALDPSAEHDLFERYASSARRENDGITVLISHRFSTVAMADLIAVLDHGQLTEYGTHHELMTARGLYAELFTLQARAYGS
ncbi:ABC transporter ATP-binding protein [Rugosimonospora africana]|uniref:ABC transporter permease n=1 Tax=Rugosimonospora africana TaxID=556532 RepID=A0A8J3R1C3_9ACTN|nr:ABC transporter ATP-binding protein [Rugosimonospora africana]GIH19565.1 ABC transporter permease [Rugosimonospora africana]